MKSRTKKQTNVLNGRARFLGAMLMAALMLPVMAFSQSPAIVALGSADTFAVLAGTSVTSVNATKIVGNIGVSPGATVTGTPTLDGSIHANDAAAIQAQLDLTIAYDDAAVRSLNRVTVAGNIGGQTLTPGLYTSSTSLAISSGDLTLDAQGDSNSVFIFQMGSTLTTTTGLKVILTGSAKASNIFWQVGSSATLGANSVFKGNLLALTSISIEAGVNLEGRVLARNGTVTLDGDTVTSRAATIIVVLPQAIVALGSADTFAVLAGASVTSVNATKVIGNIGVSPGATVTGTPALDGSIHANDAAAIQAQLDLTIAYDDAAARTVGAVTVAGNLGGDTLTPGLYTSTSTLEISSGDLVLDAEGDSNAVFIFQMASTLTTSGSVILTGSAKASNIFWQVGSSATLGAASVFKGNILALTSITMESGVILDGRALARNGTVALDGDTITSRPASIIVVLPQATIVLGSASPFAILAGTSVTSINATKVIGNIGVSPGATVSGSPTVDGTIFANDAVAAQAQLDLTIAYDDAAARTVGRVTVAGNLGGDTLTPGLYTSASSLEISSGDLVLDAQGDSNAVFIFQMASTLTTTSDRLIILINDAKASNIFWQVGSSATLGAASVFKGNILALTSITLTTGAILDGRALARTGTVTLDGNTVTSRPATPTAIETGIAAEVFALSQSYPNPFNPSAKIQYSIQKAGQVSLKVFNSLGHEVATLVNGRQEAGSHTVTFNSKKGMLNLSSGVYFCRLEAGSFVSMKKLVLVK